MTPQAAAPHQPKATDPRAFKRFAEFYPFYLSEHSNRTCRRLHFAGSTLTLICLAMLIAPANHSTCCTASCVAMALHGWATLASRRTSPPASSGRFTASWATG